MSESPQTRVHNKSELKGSDLHKQKQNKSKSNSPHKLKPRLLVLKSSPARTGHAGTATPPTSHRSESQHSRSYIQRRSHVHRAHRSQRARRVATRTT